jgi:hypothetical protein
VLGPEVGEARVDALVYDAVPEHVDRAPSVELVREPVGELPLGHVGVAAVALDEVVPRVDLSGAEERVELPGVETAHRVEVARVPLQLVVLDGGVAAVRSEPVAVGRSTARTPPRRYCSRLDPANGRKSLEQAVEGHDGADPGAPRADGKVCVGEDRLQDVDDLGDDEVR